MIAVDYAYYPPGRLVRVVARHLSAWTVLRELLGSYRGRRLPSLRNMWVERTTEYAYDADHNLRTIREPGVELTNHYDAAHRVVRQDVAGWGSWRFAYTEDETGRVVQTDVTDPDGHRRRVVFNRNGYPLRDARAPGEPHEQTTEYERAPDSNAVTRVVVTCRAASGDRVRAPAPVTGRESADAVRQRLLQRCAGLAAAPRR